MNSEILKQKVLELVEKVGPSEAFKMLVAADVSGAMATKLTAGNYNRGLGFDNAQKIIGVLREQNIVLPDEAAS